MLTRQTFRGPWAGLPVPWTPDDRLDEDLYRAMVRLCCDAGVPGVYSGGTTGEFYAMEFDEFSQVARATVEACHACGKPAMVGCSAFCTRGACMRAAFARDIGADAVQVALPGWQEVPDRAVVPFFEAVADAAAGLPLSVYDTTRTGKALPLALHEAIRAAVPSYMMVKATGGTVGAAEDGCAELSRLVNVFSQEHAWPRLGPRGLAGCCSSMAYWNPRLTLGLWRQVEAEDWAGLESAMKPIKAMYAFLHDEFGPRGFTDTAYDRMVSVATGFLPVPLANRGPYPSASMDDVNTMRAWLTANFPAMLEL